ncbi:MAG: M20/M25/M40 family metallo-hydrolase [Vicinamibacterales bacterium]
MMRRKSLLGVSLAAVLGVATFGLPLRAADEPIDYDGLNKIKDQGLVETNSQVMDIASWLTDVYGPRLTGSPNISKAGAWAVETMKGWGLENVAMEPWAMAPGDTSNGGFPQGWSNEKFYMAAVSPQSFPIPGTPTAWTPGTNGLVRGEVMLVTGTTQEELQPLAASLKGKWILTAEAPDVAAYWSAPASRYTKEELADMESPERRTEFGQAQPAGRGGGRGGFGRGGAGGFNRDEFFQQSGVLGVLSTQSRGHGIYTIGGGSRTADPNASLTRITIPAEQYGRLARMIAHKQAVTVEADIRNVYAPNPPMFNVVGEIRGTERPDEVVMLGAHFDSWHASTGATDNAAGSAAMMEAMRILKQSGVRLKRTVRIGLWTGEEQGLIGSRNYVAEHFGNTTAGRGGGGRGARGAAPPQRMPATPAHAKFAGYFNIDNGTGAIRGVYLQGNQAVAPIFRAWMEPFHSIGMTTLTISNTGGTDHQSFDGAGLPGFQFIQDEVEYGSMTHHTNLDSYERLQPEDMRRNATIAAAFAYLTANRDDLLPRKPDTPLPGGRGRGGEE